METKPAVSTLAALAHDVRLTVYRMLVEAGDDGMAAGEISDRIGMHKATLSNHLKILLAAGVVDQERRSRSLIYRARPERVVALSRLLVEG
ncbi:ArsR/SmtB family transcription factor [Sphingomonas sp. RIT328]|uniref:ArsR/SmtB family transcription factor n=1 Tax=Sphingomonas sp. RIT328 TaxID=1470591 RepID=UPI00044EF7E9|nr:metalloregulator ArsR/SmtB family transcription factor [Sphingomonas sp. RIT328]EZP49944.1 Transcriptional regulator, ArsR family [Sphingomonas sp. RIT328]